MTVISKMVRNAYIAVSKFLLMKFVLVVIFLFLSISSFSQRLISGQAYGTTSAEEGMKMIHTKDNGYLFVGRTYYPGNSRYFAKLDSNFNLLWQKRVPDYGYFIWDIIIFFYKFF